MSELASLGDAFKPAAPIEMHKLVRPKLTGVVVEILNNAPFMDVNGKREPIPNKMVSDILGGLPQFKGEIVVGKPEDPECYDITMEFLKDEHLLHLWVFWVYDLRTTNLYPLKDRLQMVEAYAQTCGPNVQYVDHELIETQQALTAYKAKVVKQGFKGIVLREPFGTFGHEDEEITAETAIA